MRNITGMEKSTSLPVGDELIGTQLNISVKNSILVQGTWADGSSWSKGIPLSEAEVLHVVAVQDPLTSLADDVASTKRAIELQDVPVLLVGHSWGGAT